MMKKLQAAGTRSCIALLALLIFGNEAAWCASSTTAPTSCPVERVGAWIRYIVPPTGNVRLFRPANAPAPVSVNVGECLMFGDRLQADHALAEIETSTGIVKIGNYQASDSYEVATPSGMGERGAWSGLQELFDNLRSLPRPPRAGVGRGSEEQCVPLESENHSASLQPISRLSATEQRVGTDLSTLLIAWKAITPEQKVTVTLESADGAVIDTQEVCGTTSVRLHLKSEKRSPGSLLIKAQSATGKPLTWKVQLVAPEVLPHPAGNLDPGWSGGVWCLYHCSADFQLDAVSRLQLESKSYLAASWILEDALTERDLPK